MYNHEVFVTFVNVFFLIIIFQILRSIYVFVVYDEERAKFKFKNKPCTKLIIASEESTPPFCYSSLSNVPFNASVVNTISPIIDINAPRIVG